MNRLLCRSAAVAAVIVLSACKTTGTTQTNGTIAKTPIASDTAAVLTPEGLNARAEARWNHIINKRFDEAYDMFTPGYRQSMPREDYVNTIKNRPLRWTEAAAVDQACTSALSCKVKIKIKFQLTMPGAGEVNSEDHLYEDWLQVNGNWYYLPKTVQAQ